MQGPGFLGQEQPSRWGNLQPNFLLGSSKHSFLLEVMLEAWISKGRQQCQ